MSPLVKIRSERDRMSAVERRIADFILENAQLLRDYSSQQLASALGISQSSVVKFTQKLGFRGYPDLKYSVGEAIGRTEETGDLLIVFSEHGKHPALVKLARYFREHRGRVATVTRHTSNPLRALSDVSLAVAAHDDASYVQSLIYQSTVQQLLDTVFVHLCEGDEARHARLVENLDRIHQMLGAT